MASSWGINKTMSQIHALLYAQSNPLDTDSIMNKLQISRGNANMNCIDYFSGNLFEKKIIQATEKITIPQKQISGTLSLPSFVNGNTEKLYLSEPNY